MTPLQATNPGYDLVIDRLHPYYIMHLVTFGIDRDENLIIQFLGGCLPYNNVL